MKENEMKDEELRDRWMEETGAPPSDRDGCPSPDVLLELAERGLVAGAEGDGALLHLARCSTCREEIAVAGALLRAAREEEEAAARSPRDTASGGERGAAGRHGPGLRRRRSMALAASVVFAVGLGVLARWVMSGGADDPVVRGGVADLPAAEATCSVPGIVELRWDPVPGAARYRVEVFTEIGDLLSAEHVAGTSARLVLPERSPSEGAALLHVMEAELPGGMVLTSPATALPPGCFPTG
jgi:hypothetical protein